VLVSPHKMNQKRLRSRGHAMMNGRLENHVFISPLFVSTRQSPEFFRLGEAVVVDVGGHGWLDVETDTGFQGAGGGEGWEGGGAMREGGREGRTGGREGGEERTETGRGGVLEHGPLDGIVHVHSRRWPPPTPPPPLS
jgi:hypothetical protein